MNHPFRQYYSAESTSNLKLRVVVFQVSGHNDTKPITSLVEAAEEEERKRRKKQKQKNKKNKNGASEDPDTAKNEDDDDDDSAAVTRFEQSFRWQEKLFSPQEIYRLTQDPARSAARAAAAVAAGGDPASTATTKNTRFLENQYRALLQQQHAGKSAKELIKPIMLFNYIDKDSYVQSKRRLTSSHMEETTPLAQQMMSLNAGFQAGSGGGSGGGGGGSGVRSWIETTAMDMAHISKDFKFRTMQIMLASNVSLEEHHELGFDGEAKTAGVVVHNHRATPGVTMSETMLASVRAFANSSRIDIQPPLNPRGRDDPYLAPGSPAPDVGEPFWYTLVTSHGQTFRYTLFNESELGEDEQAVLDAVRQKEHELYEREQANLQNQVGFTFHGAPALHFATRVHALLEIVSAAEFIGAEFLYVRYKLLLPPRGWEHTSQVTHDGDNHFQGDSSIASHGSTQTSRVVFRPPRFNPSVHHRFGSSVKEESVAHFCHPVEFNVQLRETPKGHVPFESQVPQIMFMVCSRDSSKRHNAVGFGHFTLPRRPGMLDQEISMWRPEGSAWDRIAGYFMGGPLELDDFGFAGKVATQNGSTNRYGFRTVTAGKLRLRGSVMMQGAPMEMTSQGLQPAVAVPDFKLTARSPLDDILERFQTVKALQQRGELRSKDLQSKLEDLGATLSMNLTQVQHKRADSLRKSIVSRSSAGAEAAAASASASAAVATGSAQSEPKAANASALAEEPDLMATNFGLDDSAIAAAGDELAAAEMAELSSSDDPDMYQ